MVSVVQSSSRLPLEQQSPVLQISRDQLGRLDEASVGCWSGIGLFVQRLVACFICWWNRRIDFSSACSSGNLSLVQAHLRTGNLDQATLSSGLRAAFNGNQDDVFMALIQAGVSINRACGRTMLHDALENNREALALRMIEAGADVFANNQASEEDKPITPLLIACEKGLADAAKAIIEKGVTGKDEFILLGDNSQGLRILQGAGFDVIKTRFALGQTALHMACQLRAVDFVSHLAFMNHYYRLVNEQDDRGRTPLYYALESKEMALALLGAGAKNEMVRNTTLLLKALEASADRAVIYGLIKTRHNLDVVGSQGAALHVAIEKGDVELVKMLVDNGAGLSIRTADGKTPLALALKKNHQEMVGYLISQYAQKNLFEVLNEVDLAKQTPQVAQSLIEAGVKVKAKTVVCAIRNYDLLKALLKDPQAPTLAALHVAVRRGDLEAVKILLLKKLTPDQINRKNKKGLTALHEAVKIKRIGIVEALVNAGASVNMTDVLGRTSLHYACSVLSGENERPLVEFLLQKGAEKNIKCSRDCLPHHYIPESDPAGIRNLFIPKKPSPVKKAANSAVAFGKEVFLEFISS